MAKFLLDANLSPKTARYLRSTLDLDVVSILDEQLSALPDTSVVRHAQEQERVIITFDGDFAKIYFRAAPGTIGVIYLRLPKELQFVPEVNRILDRFFRIHAASIDLDHALVTVTESVVSIVRR